MTNPQPDRLRPKPRRAEALQPDQPGQGTSKPKRPVDSPQTREKAASKKQKAQTDAALENVREGYD